MTNFTQWLILSVITSIFTLFFFGVELGIDNFIISFVGLGLSFVLLIFMYRTYFLRDTDVVSPFFSVDRVRSIRYSLVYFLVIFASTVTFMLVSPLIVAGMVTVVAFLLILVLNIFIGIIVLIQFLIGGGMEFIGFENALIPFFFLLDIYDNFNPSQDLLSFVLVILVLLSLIVACYFTGRYVEDTSTNFAVVSLHTLIILNLAYSLRVLSPTSFDFRSLYVAQSTSIFIILGLLLYPFLNHFLLQIFFITKENNPDFELPEVGKKTQFLFVLVTFIFVGLSIGGLAIMWLEEFIYRNSSIIYLVGFIFLVVSLLLVLFGFWMKVGDFTVDIRIDEIEYREELLKKAKEFREME